MFLKIKTLELSPLTIGFIHVKVLEYRTHSVPHTKARKSLTFSFFVNKTKLKSAN